MGYKAQARLLEKKTHVACDRGRSFKHLFDNMIKYVAFYGEALLLSQVDSHEGYS